MLTQPSPSTSPPSPNNLNMTNTIYISGIPPGSHLGLDLSSFTVPASGFTGLTDLPPGLHHVWLSAYPTLSLRTGLWLKIPDSGSETLHYVYSATSESLEPIPITSTSTSLIHTSDPDLIESSGLLSYRQRSPTTGQESSSAAEWNALTRHITPTRLTSLCGAVWRTTSITSSASTTSVSAAQQREDALLAAIPVHVDVEDPGIAWTSIDLKRSWRDGAVGRERTEMARDKSWLFSTAVERWGDVGEGEEGLLAELETSFVLAIWLGNIAAAEQWRRIVACVLGVRRYEAHVDCVCGFLKILRRMVEVLAGGIVGDGAFLGDDDLANVERGLRGFETGLRESEEGAGREKVRKQMEWVKTWALEEMAWTVDTREVLRRGTVMTEEGDVVEVQEEGLEEEEESGEYAPVIVEIVEEPAPARGEAAKGDVIGGREWGKEKEMTEEELEKEEEEELARQLAMGDDDDDGLGY